MSKVFRLIKIAHIFSKYRLDDLFRGAPLPPRLKLLFTWSPARLLPSPKQPRGTRLRLALEELGPIFIKFGQMLSTRRDLLPDDIANELQQLQDRVPPFPEQLAIALIEKALGKPTSELFATFDSKPLASASVAQVHSATLANGQQVVVKVIRPGIEQTIAQDLSLLTVFAKLLERYWPDGKRLHPMQIVSDYEKTIYNELDLQIEAGNTSQLKRNFEHSELLYVPQVYWDYTRKNVLVMERIYGIPVADIAALKAQHIEMKQLAERGVEIFFTQVFRDSFFHADMHPGNIFVSRKTPERPQYIAIDCAIVGSLTNEDKNYLARILLAFFKRNYHQVAQLHIDCGWVPAKTPVNEFETAIRSVCEPIFEKPLKDISFGQILLRLFQTARRFDMEVQPQLVLLQKTLLNVEGLGRQIYPELDLWNTAMPFLENWMKQRMGPEALLKAVREQGPDWLEQGSELPQLLLDSVQQLKHVKTWGTQQKQILELLKANQSKPAKPAYPVWLGIGAFAIAALTANLHAASVSLPVSSILFGLLGIYFLAKR